MDRVQIPDGTLKFDLKRRIVSRRGVLSSKTVHSYRKKERETETETDERETETDERASKT